VPTSPSDDELETRPAAPGRSTPPMSPPPSRLRRAAPAEPSSPASTIQLTSGDELGGAPTWLAPLVADLGRLKQTTAADRQASGQKDESLNVFKAQTNRTLEAQSNRLNTLDTKLDTLLSGMTLLQEQLRGLGNAATATEKPSASSMSSARPWEADSNAGSYTDMNLPRLSQQVAPKGKKVHFVASGPADLSPPSSMAPPMPASTG
jgi:hypothetical protein